MLKILLVLSIDIVFVREVKIVPKRYSGSLLVNWLQSYKLSKLKDDLIIRESNTCSTRVVRGGPRSRIFFRSPTLRACSFAAL